MPQFFSARHYKLTHVDEEIISSGTFLQIPPASAGQCNKFQNHVLKAAYLIKCVDLFNTKAEVFGTLVSAGMEF